MRLLRLFCFLALVDGLLPVLASAADDRPNILWIVSEDNAPFLGCYGDENAKTPNLDRLAERGIRYDNFFANAPVCAVARSSWIFGVPAVTIGTLHMRSEYRVPRERFQTYPELMRSAGYYATNHYKTDYNTGSIDPYKIWNASSRKAHYKNRPEGTPFFAVFNIFDSHESRIFPKHKPEKKRVPAEAIQVPPYQTASPETIDDWRAYYEKLEHMDNKVGRLVQELEASGEADNTIIVYCSDHGGVTLRSKRYLHDSGTRVPLIIAFPPKWQHLAPSAPGTSSDRLVQFIDLPKTFLSLMGAELPEVMPGRVFLGDALEPAPETVFLFSGRFDESPDNSRAVTDGRWKYIRNFESDRPLFQMLDYPMRQAGQMSQWKAYQEGKTNEMQSAHYLPQPPEALFDTHNDPDEVNNLIDSEPEKLKWMRAQLREHILATRDLGFIPEPMMEAIDGQKEETIYDFGQSETNYPLSRVLDLAMLASAGDPANQPEFVQAFEDENPIIRYWAMVGLRVLGSKARNVDSLLDKAVDDASPSVRIQAAICLARQGQRARALQFLIREAKAASNDIHATWALDGIKLLNAPEALDPLSDSEIKRLQKGPYSKAVLRLLRNDGSVSRMPE